LSFPVFNCLRSIQQISPTAKNNIQHGRQRPEFNRLHIATQLPVVVPNIKKDGELGNYLAGLIESDGTIITPKEGSKTTPKIGIIFNIKDKSLAIHIRNILIYGSIQIDEKTNSVNLIIRDKKGILDFISLINGKLRTPKLFKLHNLIKYINNSTYYAPLLTGKIKLLPLDYSSLASNSWLAGFSEGDSSFQIRLTKPSENRKGKGKSYNRVATTFELSQSRTDPDLFEKYEGIMQIIAVYLLAKLSIVNLSTYDRLGTQTTWRTKNTSLAGALVLVNYFNQFPLYSSKHLDFLCWSEAYFLIKNKQHFIKNGVEGLNRIEHLKNSMNNKRVDFNWDHLNNFYTRN